MRGGDPFEVHDRAIHGLQRELNWRGSARLEVREHGGGFLQSPGWYELTEMGTYESFAWGFQSTAKAFVDVDIFTLVVDDQNAVVCGIEQELVSIFRLAHLFIEALPFVNVRRKEDETFGSWVKAVFVPPPESREVVLETDLEV